MITKLRIKNFKSIADSGELEIRPLTFLMGPNSSGKSAIMQTLLLLRQTADARDVRNPLAISGSYMDFGSYRDFIYRHDDSKQLSIQLWFKPSAMFLPVTPQQVQDQRNVFMAVQEVCFSVRFRYVRKSMRVLLEDARWETVEPRWSALAQRKQKVDAGGRIGEYYDCILTSDGLQETVPLERSKFYDFSLAPLRRARDFPSRPVFEVLFSLSECVETLFRHVFYIGPLREWPERSYTASGATPQDVGLKGELSVDVLHTLRRRSKATKDRVFEWVNKWMQEFDLALDVKVTRLSGNTYRLTLTDPQSELQVNLADVGFGASQVFPIIVEGFYSPEGSLLLIEQPEIHLHPRAQATLADLLVAVVHEKKTLLVETHSEHLISRVQRRIAEGVISNSDVALYYCEATPDGTNIREIAFNEMGQFETEGLPEGFFEEGYLESMEHMKAMAKRVQSV